MDGSYESSYGGGFNSGTKIGFTGGEGGFTGGEGGFAGGEGGYVGEGFTGEGYDYDSDVASLVQGKVLAEERTNFG